MDYVALSALPLGFSAMSVVGDTQCVAISIVNDFELEGKEAFIAEVAITMVADEREIIQSSFITIVDDDGTSLICGMAHKALGHLVYYYQYLYYCPYCFVFFPHHYSPSNTETP